MPTHWNVAHDAVLGAVIRPVLSVPSTSMWKVLLLYWLLTSASMRYVPGEVTLMVYSSHSPVSKSLTTYPPAYGLMMSTSSVRYKPP